MSHRILLVDDEPNILASIRRLLHREPGCEIQAASGGEEALALLAAWRPDLILLDVMMPGMGGHELCRRIRAEARHRFVKILFISGMCATADRLAGYEAGADDFVCKPFDADELLAKVRVFLRLKRAEELDDIKGSLLTLFAHETRTPLTIILGASEVLLASPSPADAEYRDLLLAIRDGGTRLNQFARKILRLCQLKEGVRLQPQAASVMTRLAGLAQRFADATAARGARLVVEAPPDLRLEADWGLVDEALGHVLENALRFTPAGGSVRLQAAASNGRVLIQVADEGPGVPPESRARVFDGFSTQDLAHHQQGQGLSLAIARYVMDAHGGSIEVADAPGGGALFGLTFPPVRAGATLATTASALAPA